MDRRMVEHVGAVLGSPREGAADVFFQQIDQSGDLPMDVDAREAASAVLCTLFARLELAQAREVRESLPPGVQEVASSCALHTGAPGESLSKETFLRRVASHLQTSPEAVEPLVATVMRAIRAQLAPNPTRTVETQLPADLLELWRGGARH